MRGAGLVGLPRKRSASRDRIHGDDQHRAVLPVGKSRRDRPIEKFAHAVPDSGIARANDDQFGIQLLRQTRQGLRGLAGKIPSTPLHVEWIKNTGQSIRKISREGRLGADHIRVERHRPHRPVRQILDRVLRDIDEGADELRVKLPGETCRGTENRIGHARNHADKNG